MRRGAFCKILYDPPPLPLCNPNPSFFEPCRKTGLVQIKVTSLRRVWSPKPFPATKHYEDATFLFARGYKFKPRVWSRRPHRRGGVCPLTRFWDILNLAAKHSVY